MLSKTLMMKWHEMGGAGFTFSEETEDLRIAA